MTSPNAMVEAYGESVTLERVTNAVFDDNRELDPAASTIESVTIEMFVSSPSEEDIVRAEGRVSLPTLKGTVDSSIDIQADRRGRPDRITRGGTTYSVDEVRSDTHPMLDLEKQTVLLGPLPGRG